LAYLKNLSIGLGEGEKQMAISPNIQAVTQRLRNRESLLTVAEASDLLQIHPVTLRDWIRAKRLSAFLVGNQWRIDPAVLADWLQARVV
jgi:excisionase family DNA binding protein